MMDVDPRCPGRKKKPLSLHIYQRVRTSMVSCCCDSSNESIVFDEIGFIVHERSMDCANSNKPANSSSWTASNSLVLVLVSLLSLSQATQTAVPLVVG